MNKKDKNNISVEAEAFLKKFRKSTKNTKSDKMEA